MRPVVDRLLLGLALGPWAWPAAADVRLPALFGDGMVLQADLPLRLFGWADPGEEVEVLFLGEEHLSSGAAPMPARRGAAQADARGRFELELEALPAGGPYRVELRASNQVVLRDVLLGEVWICSGQSNMEWPVAQSQGAEDELAGADQPHLRLFRVTRAAAAEPAEEVRGSWAAAAPGSVADFSAVGYSFGRALAQHTGRPVGLIQAAWGGTTAEAWTERSFLEGAEAFAPILERRPEHPAQGASALYNGMIAPLTGLRVRGAIWYQGESNARRAEQYRDLFPALIRSWRAAFSDPDLAFLFVQLANYRARVAEPAESEWAELREAQALALELPRTGMATAVDVGDADDIHPRDKRTVGERLALVARAVVHGEELVHSGPVLRSVERRGSELVLSFDHAAGLATRDGAPPQGFAVAGADGEFRWARARIEGQRVLLGSPEVPEPLHVRHAWADNPALNLVNGANLPALPFRTDRRPPVTAGRR